MRAAWVKPSQGALPPYPRDISFQYESLSKVFHTGTNIPAGGSDLDHQRNATERSAQNSFFKNFVAGRARR